MDQLHELFVSVCRDGVDQFLIDNPKVEEERRRLDGVIEELDVKLDRQLKKQETSDQG